MCGSSVMGLGMCGVLGWVFSTPLRTAPFQPTSGNSSRFDTLRALVTKPTLANRLVTGTAAHR